MVEFLGRRVIRCLEQRDSDDLGMEDFDQRRMSPNFGDPSGQRHVRGERRCGTHTADKMLAHRQILQVL